MGVHHPIISIWHPTVSSATRLAGCITKEVTPPVHFNLLCFFGYNLPLPNIIYTNHRGMFIWYHGIIWDSELTFECRWRDVCRYYNWWCEDWTRELEMRMGGRYSYDHHQQQHNRRKSSQLMWMRITHYGSENAECLPRDGHGRRYIVVRFWKWTLRHEAKGVIDIFTTSHHGVDIDSSLLVWRWIR